MKNTFSEKINLVEDFLMLYTYTANLNFNS